MQNESSATAGGQASGEALGFKGSVPGSVPGGGGPLCLHMASGGVPSPLWLRQNLGQAGDELLAWVHS